MSENHRAELSKRLRPIAPPRVVDCVLTPDQHASVLDLIRRYGPWDSIIKHHFQSLEELVATVSGGQRTGSDVNLDSFLSPYFRGFFAEGGVCLYEEAESLFYDPRLLCWAREYWKARYARPMKILFNVSGPTRNFDPGHLDSPRFRGMGLSNTPTWLLSVMGKSGLFQPWAIRMAEVIVWFYKGSDGGGFTYWPDGPLAPPRRLAPPLWNRGVVVQNTNMYHRGEASGPLDQRANPNGLTFDSTFCADPSNADRWQIRTGEEVIAGYSTEELRLLVHWDAELYTDLDDLKLHVDGLDDLSPDRVFETLIADLRGRGVPFDPPSNPMRDPTFIALLAATYDVPPGEYPAEAPVDGWAA
jgi:hypothetical protein